MNSIDIFTMITSFADITSVQSGYGFVDVYATMKYKPKTAQLVALKEGRVSIYYASENDKFDIDKSLVSIASNGTNDDAKGKKIIVTFKKESEADNG